MYKKIVVYILLIVFAPALTWSVEVYRDGDVFLDVNFWGQAWYQWVEDERDTDDDGIQEENLNDFMFRRAYMGIKGAVTPRYEFFVHFAADRLGQDGLDAPGSGLGSGLAVRDAWITAKLLGDDLMLQIGRMYVPLTRNYGTTSTKALLTTDLDWTQGGIRGSIFYPNKVGRDDGLALWGNVMEDRFQYRFMIAEGIEGSTVNPDDSPRFVGRVSASLMEPETDWFNQGTYLGKKNVLSIGIGVDTQDNLVLNERNQDYTAWTGDIFYDGGGLTVEAAYIGVKNAPNAINFTHMSTGDDVAIISVKAGYLLPGEIIFGQVQPFIHYENVNVDGKGDTNIFGAGFNHFIKGHANKLSLDLTYLDQEEETTTLGVPPVQDHLVVTFQMAAGF